jgi:hypothetical protein
MKNDKSKKIPRLYLINRDFQLRYMMVALAVGAGSTTVTLAVVLIPLFHLQIIRFPNFLPTPFLIGMALAALSNFITVAGLSVFITHRIAGPMFSMVRYLHLVRERNAKAPLRVRENDDLRFLVRNINDFFEYLNSLNNADTQVINDAIQLIKSPELEDQKKAIEILDNLKGDMVKRRIPQNH